MNILRMKDEDETLDAFYDGRIHVLQKKKGYRFSVDASLLADFIQPQKKDELLELGTGSGIISLLLSVKSFSHITAVELQPSLADLARRNISLNHLQDRIKIVEADLRLFSSGRKFDKIFSNPPYHKKGAGHISSSRERAIAKHELACDIFDIMKAASNHLKTNGRAYFIYPYRQQGYFMEALMRFGMRIKCRRDIIPRPGSKPNLFLCETDFTAVRERRLTPFILHRPDGKYSREAEDIFKGKNYVEIDS